MSGTLQLLVPAPHLAIDRHMSGTSLACNLWDLNLCGNQPVSEVFVKLHAMEPTRSRGQRRVDGVGRLKFDFHTGGAEKMLRFFRPWGNKDHEAAPAQTRPGRAAFRQSPRAQGFGGGRGDDGDY